MDPAAYAASLARLAAVSGYPILAEPTGGLRFGPHDQRLVIDGYDAFLRLPGWVATQAPQLVLRFGGSLTWRPVTQYLEAHPGARHGVFDPLDQGDDPTRLAAEWVAAGGWTRWLGAARWTRARPGGAGAGGERRRPRPALGGRKGWRQRISHGR